MFDLDQFIADCKAALREGEPTRATEEVVTRAVADPAAVIAALGAPRVGRRRSALAGALVLPQPVLRPRHVPPWFVRVRRRLVGQRLRGAAAAGPL